MVDQSTVSSDLSEDLRLIVVAPTFYSDPSDVRYQLALESCREAAEHSVAVVLIDASPSEDLREGLRNAGGGFVEVFSQTSPGKKGAALREGIRRAADNLRRNNDDDDARDAPKPTGRSIIGFQELEKVDLMRHWKSIARHAQRSGADVVVPRRRDKDFSETYPIEQYHSERFANLFLDSLGSQLGLASIDWTNGPVALDAALAETWLACDGEIWDAQLVPIVDAFLRQNATVASFEIAYRHPQAMKEQEGGNAVFNEKRLHQLNFLSDTVGQRMREAIARRSEE